MQIDYEVRCCGASHDAIFFQLYRLQFTKSHRSICELCLWVVSEPLGPRTAVAEKWTDISRHQYASARRTHVFGIFVKFSEVGDQVDFASTKEASSLDDLPADDDGENNEDHTICDKQESHFSNSPP